MKTYISFAILVTLLFSGCAKYELEDNISYGKYQLTLNISPFEKSDFDVNSSSRTVVGIGEICSQLGFAVFDESGKKVFSSNQEQTTSGFGTLETNINEGMYDVVVVAHSTAGSATISKPDSIRFKDNKVSDTFSYYERITINADVVKSVTMQRSVAMFRFRLKEKIPESVKQLKFLYTGGSSTLNATTNFGRIKSRQTEVRDVPASAYTSDDNVFEIYTIPHAEEGTLRVTVTALDADGKELFERVFEDVPIAQNKITTYVGVLFGNANEDTPSQLPLNVTLTADDSWQGENSYTF